MPTAQCMHARVIPLRRHFNIKLESSSISHQNCVLPCDSGGAISVDSPLSRRLCLSSSHRAARPGLAPMLSSKYQTRLTITLNKDNYSYTSMGSYPLLSLNPPTPFQEMIGLN